MELTSSSFAAHGSEGDRPSFFSPRALDPAGVTVAHVNEVEDGIDEASEVAPPFVSLLVATLHSRLTATPVLLITMTLLYLIPTLWIARQKLFWDDEFYTYYLSRLTSWHELLKALATGADQHPPSFYYVTHISQRIFGATHVGTRMPEVVGFWLLCVCLFFIVRPATNTSWALVAMLFPLSTKLYYYATEARGYGMVAGFTALALLSWMRASEGRRRALFLPLLAVSMMGAVGSHYYAIFGMSCLALGEGVRTWLRRRVDVPVCLAIGCAALPLVTFLDTIGHAREYSKHFWAVPKWPEALIYYKYEFGSALVAQLAAIGLVLFLGAGTKGSGFGIRVRTKQLFRPWEIAAIVSLCLLPLIVMTIAKWVTHGFSDRYAIPALVGITVLLSCVYYRMTQHVTVGIAALTAGMAMFGYQVLNLHGTSVATAGNLRMAYRMLAETGEQAVVCMDYSTFHRLSFYAPRELARRLTYASDPAASIRYLGNDTIDRGMLDLSPWFPLQTASVGTFLTQHHEFLTFGNFSESWTWITYELPSYGKTELLKRDGGFLLFDTTNVVPHRYDAGLEARYPQNRMLFFSLPTTGASLCDRDMGAGSCPRLTW